MVPSRRHHLKVRIANAADPSPFFEEELIVDTGAYCSIVPARLLRKIGVEPHSRERFGPADGRSVVRDVGVAMYSVGKQQGGAPVVFGPPEGYTAARRPHARGAGLHAGSRPA